MGRGSRVDMQTDRSRAMKAESSSDLLTVLSKVTAIVLAHSRYSSGIRIKVLLTDSEAGMVAHVCYLNIQETKVGELEAS